MKRTSHLALLLVVMALGFVACGGSGSSQEELDEAILLGQWQAQSRNANGERVLLSFTKTDEQRNVAVQSISDAGEATSSVFGAFEFKQDKLAFSFPPSAALEYDYTLKSDQLVIDGVYVYQRVTKNGQVVGARLAGQVKVGETATASTSSQGLVVVPGELLLSYREGSDASEPVQGLTLSSGRRDTVTVESETASADSHLKKIRFSIQKAIQGLSLEESGFEAQVEQAREVQQNADAVANEACAELMRNDATIENCASNVLLPLMGTMDPMGALGSGDSRWNYDLINLKAAHDIERGKPSVKVAVLDSGINSEHDDLMGHLGTGYDFISDLTIAASSNLFAGQVGRSETGYVGRDEIIGRDSNPEDTVGALVNFYHGTHVAGIIAEVAPGVTIIPYRVAGCVDFPGFTNCQQTDDVIRANFALSGKASFSMGAATLYDVTDALRRAVSDDIDVINMSLAHTLDDAHRNLLKTFIDKALEADIVIVAASGNGDEATQDFSASNENIYPCAFDGVICVGMTGELGEAVVTRADETGPQGATAAYYGTVTNVGSAQDLVAPGVGIQVGIVSTTGPGINYGVLGGTSQATPHVAAVAALLKSYDSALSRQDIEDILKKSALDLGAAERDDHYGSGLLNAGAALEWAKFDSVKSIAVSTKQVHFDYNDEEFPFYVFAPNEGRSVSVSVKDASEDSWLEISKIDERQGGLLVHLKVKREGLGEGTFEAIVRAQSGSTTRELTVSVDNGANDPCAGLDAQAMQDSIACALSQDEANAQDEASAQEALDQKDIELYLIDKETGATAVHGKALAANGYHFYLDGIADGTYYFIAGIDSNGDGIVCRAADNEPCTGLTRDGSIPRLNNTSDYFALAVNEKTLLSNLRLSIQAPAPNPPSVDTSQ